MKKFNFNETYLFEGFFDELEDDLDNSDEVSKLIGTATARDLITVTTDNIDILEIYIMTKDITPKFVSYDINPNTENQIDITDITTSPYNYIRIGSNNKMLSIILDFYKTKMTTSENLLADNTKLKSIIFRNFDTSNITTMYHMFYKCSSLRTLDLNMFDTSKVTNMHGMFRRCNNLKLLDLSNFDTSNVKIISSMFEECKNLKTIIFGPKFIPDNITLANQLFFLCKSLKNITCTQKLKDWFMKNEKLLESYIPLSEINWTII